MDSETTAPVDIELVKNEMIEYEENDIEPDDSVLENLPSKSAKGLFYKKKWVSSVFNFILCFSKKKGFVELQSE